MIVNPRAWNSARACASPSATSCSSAIRQSDVWGADSERPHPSHVTSSCLKASLRSGTLTCPQEDTNVEAGCIRAAGAAGTLHASFLRNGEPVAAYRAAARNTAKSSWITVSCVESGSLGASVGCSTRPKSGTVSSDECLPFANRSTNAASSSRFWIAAFGRWNDRPAANARRHKVCVAPRAPARSVRRAHTLG